MAETSLKFSHYKNSLSYYKTIKESWRKTLLKSIFLEKKKLLGRDFSDVLVSSMIKKKTKKEL